MGDRVAKSEVLAGRELAKDLPGRWAHVAQVAAKAERIAATLPALQAEELRCAAWLHDIGYAPRVKRTGFHPLDGAVFLSEVGVIPNVCNLVANHSAAAVEAGFFGCAFDLEAFPDHPSLVRDLLWYCDMTIGPSGDLEAGVLRVVRTVVEVAGHRSFKPFPKSVAGRRDVPIPGWVLRLVAEHVERWPTPSTSPVFANEIRGPIGRTAFRARVWRPSLVRAGFIGDVHPDGKGFLATWQDRDGEKQSLQTRTHYQAVMEVSRNHHGGLRFHDLRHSYATWLVDDGVPPNMVQRVMGHERASTTLDLYTRRTADPSRIVAALTDDEEDDR